MFVLTKEESSNYFSYFFSLIFMQQLDEPFRQKDMFGNLSFFNSLREKDFFLSQFLVDILPLDPYPWIRIFLLIWIQEAKMLQCSQ